MILSKRPEDSSGGPYLREAAVMPCLEVKGRSRCEWMDTSLAGRMQNGRIKRRLLQSLMSSLPVAKVSDCLSAKFGAGLQMHRQD